MFRALQNALTKSNTRRCATRASTADRESCWSSLCTAVTGLGFYYLATFVATFLSIEVGVSKTSALRTRRTWPAYLLLMCPIAGLIGDRIGRRPTMLIGAAGIAVVAIPCFALLATGNFWLAVIGVVLLAAFEALANVTLGVLMVELFPARLRVTGSSIGFNVAQALVGGPGPFVAAAIAAAVAVAVAPAFYLVAVASVAFLSAGAVPARNPGSVVVQHRRPVPTKLTG